MNNPYIFPILFIAAWCLICFSLSYMSGWRTLAQYYPYKEESIPMKKYFQWGSLRGVNYKNCLTIGSCAQGLYLAVSFLFALGSPKLLIPWHDIKVAKKAFWGFSALELSFVRAPGITLVISSSWEKVFQEHSSKPLVIDGSNFNQSFVLNKYQWISIIMGLIGLLAALVLYGPHK